MRKAIIVLSLLVCSITSAVAAVGVSIGINIPVFPQLAVIPGYPVYYAPQLNANYFFYDGMYWCFVDDNWYASSWYNGPWELVAPEFVPVFLLRVPVRYYRSPPVYFSAWYASAPPHWGEHWGYAWEQNHRGWDTWNRAEVPAPAPLPVYQRQYSGARYPAVEQQVTLQRQNYRYQPREAVVQQQYRRMQAAAAPAQQAPVQRSAAPSPRGQPQQAERREPKQATAAPMQRAPVQQSAAPPPRGQPQQAERREARPPTQAEHREVQRTTAAPPPTRQATAPARVESSQVERSQAQRPATAPAPAPVQQATAPRSRAQPPQPPQPEHREVQRTASAPPPMSMPQRQAAPPREQPSLARAPQASGPPPQAHRQQNQEKEAEKAGQGGGK
jgi:hypothetical protein